jgi:hypothetical protein
MASVLMEPNEAKLTKGDAAANVVTLNRSSAAPLRVQLPIVQLAVQLVALNVSLTASGDQQHLCSALLGSSVPTKPAEIPSIIFGSGSSTRFITCDRVHFYDLTF